MKIGLVLPTVDHGTLDHLVAQIGDAADSGLDSVWLTHSTGFDPLTAISVAARQVPNIMLGTAVTPVQTAHPARIAAQVRTANAAADGRLVLGIGSSHRSSIEGRYGLPYESPVAYVRDYLAIAKPLIDSGSVEYQGKYLSAKIRLTDHGRGSVPVLVAALQPKMLELAGGIADGTVTWCCGVNTIRNRIAPSVVQAALAAGKPEPAVVVALPVCVTSDTREGRAAADAQLAGYGDLPVYRAVLDEEHADNPGELAVVGDEDSVLEQLKTLAEAGCTTFAAVRCGSEKDRTRTWELLQAAAAMS